MTPYAAPTDAPIAATAAVPDVMLCLTMYRISRDLTMGIFLLQSCEAVGKQVVGGRQLGTG